ncbi:unnamed protein product, partial [Adineta steineri]
HKIQDAILFPAVAYLELATAACQQLLSSKDDQQQPIIIFEDINFIKALILNEHELMEVFTQIIIPMRKWYIMFCNQDNLNKYSLNKFTLHAQGKTEIDFKEQNSLTIPDRWTTQDITSAHQYGSSFNKIKTLHDTSTTIISQLSNDNNNYSSYYLLHPYLVLLPVIETTFLSVRIQKFIYSSKTKTRMNQSTNIKVRRNYHDNICGIGQEEIYNLDLWIFPMDNKIEEPIFTFEGAVIQQIQGAHSGRWSMEQIIYDKLNLTTDLPNIDHKTYLNTILKDYCMKRLWTDSPITKDISHLLPSPNQILNNQLNSTSNQDLIESIEPFNELVVYYAQMATKDLDLNQEHHPLLNAYILSGEKTGSDIFLGDDEIEQVFHSICQYLQLQYERQTKDDNSFDNYRLCIFWLTDNDCSDILPILDFLLNLSQQTGLSIDLHYADSDPTQPANAQQTFNTHINNQTKNLSTIYDET